MSMNEEFDTWRAGILADVHEITARAIGSIHAPVRVVDIPIVLGARGSVLVVGTHVFLRLGLNGAAAVLTWSLGATVAGVASARSVQIDVQVGPTLLGLATMCGVAANRPQLIAQSERVDVVPTTWTSLAIPDPSWIYVTVMSVDGVIEVAGLTLRLAVSPR